MARMTELFALLAPEVEALGYELWGVVYLPQGQHALLRVYIEHANGIGVDDCEKVSRQVSAILDVEEVIKGRYTLEVSSPGLDRPLFTIAQYRRCIGQVIDVRLQMPINQRRKFQGELVGVEEETIQLNTVEGLINIPFAQVERANVVLVR
jgi:ribosome maturation factor RimP